jgi:hypothetical protein
MRFRYGACKALREVGDGVILPGMTVELQRVADELKRLSASEVEELSVWLADYQRSMRSTVQGSVSETAVLPDFASRARALFPDGPSEPSFLETLLEARSSRF